MVVFYLVMVCLWLVIMMLFAAACYEDRNKSGVKTFLLLAASAPVWPLVILLGLFVGIRKLVQYGWS